VSNKFAHCDSARRDTYALRYIGRREEKPIRCHSMVYCTYNILNMFRTLLRPSSGARDCMCVFTDYGVQCCTGEKI